MSRQGRGEGNTRPLRTEVATAQTLDEAYALLRVVWEDHVPLCERVAALEARLGQNSAHSSRPSSSDPPSAPKPGG